jgi:hypothetical protein
MANAFQRKDCQLADDHDLAVVLAHDGEDSPSVSLANPLVCFGLDSSRFGAPQRTM